MKTNKDQKQEVFKSAFTSVGSDISNACIELGIEQDKIFTDDETTRIFSLVEKYDLARRVVKLQEREHFLMLKAI